MAQEPKRHLIGIERFSSTQDYTYPRRVAAPFSVAPRNRAIHGNRIKSQIRAIRDQFDLNQEQEVPEGLVRDEVIYVEFFSEWGFEFKYEQLHSDLRDYYKILKVTKEVRTFEGQEQKRFKVLVMLAKRGVEHFLSKVEDYLTRNYRDLPDGNPLSQNLIANLDEIRMATLQAFWVDIDTYSFPVSDQEVWWEVWFRRSAYQKDKIEQQLEGAGLNFSPRELFFPEHVIRMVRGTAEQLASSVFLLNSLAELRRPQEINDFITSGDITYEDEQSWLQDLMSRTEFIPDAGERKVFVCLFDSGLTHRHPLIEPLVDESNLHSWNPAWGVEDTGADGGHGTGMAALVLFGDLTEALASSTPIRILHGIESFKIVQPNVSTDKELHGIIYLDGVATVSISNAEVKRVYCISVTNDGVIKSGRPSSASSTLDQIAFETSFEGAGPQLVLVSGGNVKLTNHGDYPNQNFIRSIQDPGQAYNVLTIGAFTQKDRLSRPSKYIPIARLGEMSPRNSTSAAWEPQWPNKPDLVLEGGNQVTDGHFLWAHDELDPLSVNKDFSTRLFRPFGGTSSAVAFASKMAAEILTAYPNFWPETIRGLMVHSADWTPQMLNGININNEGQRRALIRSVGYGVPNLGRALYSAGNSLTLIAQAQLKPYRLDRSNVRYNEFHLYKIPWPTEVLQDQLFDQKVTIKVTLSYFIEPNPGAREYAKNFSYHSHSLDFKLIKEGESPSDFQRRVSAATEVEDEDESPDFREEDWTIKERVRSKGSIKKDFLETNGANLASRNLLAVYPKSGWYRTRKSLEKYDQEVRYSLIVSIETPIEEVDIYTPVENLITIPIRT
ncbi:Subtilase family protein [Algoriphagus faecimaris]|uniref:Subtilase family protein n=1 Tax=Algoriphagus faecimaris TaxID=686796 RepID=A0A1G6XYZ1_9BACT|nr:S8 family peptidase [Algoriphagus faecimaris]SDD83241.1 Subtilase family protein [Algoriphagus faecimaris]